MTTWNGGQLASFLEHALEDYLYVLLAAACDDRASPF